MFKLLSIVLSLIVACTGVLAQNKDSPPPSEFKDILKNLESKEILKLRGSEKQEVAVALSSKLQAQELNQLRSYQVEVDKVEPWRFPNVATPGWRILTQTRELKSGSVKIAVVCNIYIREDPDKILTKLKKGSKVKAVGKVTRCDLTFRNEAELNVDLHTGTLEVIGK